MANISLLDLPPEIWSKIVQLAVEFDSPINIYPNATSTIIKREQRFSSIHAKPKKSEPAITAVCRAIRAESLLHYYQANVFYRAVYFTPDRNIEKTHALKPLADWLDNIGRENVEALCKVYYINAYSRIHERDLLDLDYPNVRVRLLSESEHVEWQAAMPEKEAKIGVNHVAKVEIGQAGVWSAVQQKVGAILR